MAIYQQKARIRRTSWRDRNDVVLGHTQGKYKNNSQTNPSPSFFFLCNSPGVLTSARREGKKQNKRVDAIAAAFVDQEPIAVLVSNEKGSASAKVGR